MEPELTRPYQSSTHHDFLETTTLSAWTPFMEKILKRLLSVKLAVEVIHMVN
jgi:hypothetical protein